MISGRTTRPVAFILALVGLLSVQRSAGAVTFSQLTPASCPTMTELTYSWNALSTWQGFEGHWFDISTLYHNNQTSERYFLANPKSQKRRILGHDA